jgi:multiple sugar transport system permease protein
MKNSVTYCLTALLVIATLLPIVWIFSQSIKTEAEIFSIPPVLVPRQVTLDNFIEVFDYFGFAVPLLRSLLVAGSTTLITIVIAALGGYGLSRYPIPGAKFVLLFIIVTRMIMPAALLTPMYYVFNFFGLIDTPFAIIIADLTMTVPLGVWLLKAFFDDLPIEIEEAALIDGAGTLGIIWRIVVPIAMAGIIVVALLSFQASWSDYMLAVSFAPGFRVGSTAIAGMISSYKIWWGDIAAGGLLFSIPLIIIAVVLEKYLVRGLTAGAVKA